MYTLILQSLLLSKPDIVFHMVIEETVAQLTSLKKESRLVFDLSKYQNSIKFNQIIRKLKDHNLFFLSFIQL